MTPSLPVRLDRALVTAATAATGLPPRAAVEALLTCALAVPPPPPVEEQLAGLRERVARLEAGYTSSGGG